MKRILLAGILAGLALVVTTTVQSRRQKRR